MKEWSRSRSILCVLICAASLNLLEAQEVGTVLPFLEWPGTVVAGYVSYGEDRQPLQASLDDLPRGVQLQAQPAHEKRVFFRRSRPWEEGYMGHFQILLDEGRFRMWYATGPFPQDRPPGLKRNHSPFVCYAESDDGIEWRRPSLGLYEFQGSKDNNIILSQTSGLGGSLLTVMRDSDAPASERYKGLFLPGDSSQIVAAVSEDGLRWRRLPEPLLTGRFDTQNVITYQHEIDRYVMYVRSGRSNRRGVGRTEGRRFVGPWSKPRLSLLLGPTDPPDADIYAPGYCRYPYGPYHLMFLSIYNRAQDTIDVQLAVSRDGELWDRALPPAVIDLAAAEEGQPPYGSLYVAPGLHPLDESTWGVPYVAHGRRHNLWDPQRVAPRSTDGDGEYLWALWKRDRLMALTASDEGQITLHRGFKRGQGPLPGSRIYLNHQTDAIGWVRVELAQGEAPLAGYSFDDCDPIRGDDLRQLVTWKGSSRLPEAGTELKVRIHLVKARLFSVEFLQEAIAGREYAPPKAGSKTVYTP